MSHRNRCRGRGRVLGAVQAHPGRCRCWGSERAFLSCRVPEEPVIERGRKAPRAAGPPGRIRGASMWPTVRPRQPASLSVSEVIDSVPLARFSQSYPLPVPREAATRPLTAIRSSQASWVLRNAPRWRPRRRSPRRCLGHAGVVRPCRSLAASRDGVCLRNRLIGELTNPAFADPPSR